jgi:hypothetical protein
MDGAYQARWHLGLAVRLGAHLAGHSIKHTSWAEYLNVFVSITASKNQAEVIGMKMRGSDLHSAAEDNASRLLGIPRQLNLADHQPV